eukprot:329259-Chlamydomonas_euryale.AAC.9
MRWPSMRVARVATTRPPPPPDCVSTSDASFLQGVSLAPPRHASLPPAPPLGSASLRAAAHYCRRRCLRRGAFCHSAPGRAASSVAKGAGAASRRTPRSSAHSDATSDGVRAGAGGGRGRRGLEHPRSLTARADVAAAAAAAAAAGDAHTRAWLRGVFHHAPHRARLHRPSHDEAQSARRTGV